MRQNERDRRNYIIGGLLVLVMFMTIGFAAFRTALNINGTASITSNWCVGFDNRNTEAYQITKGVSAGTNPTGEISFSGTACSTNYVPNSTLTANFYQPGDKVEYTLTIANKSSMGAAIESIEVNGNDVTSNQTITDGNIIWKVYMPEATTLASNATTTMKVSAEFQNTTDISNLTTGGSSSLTVGINVVQDDGNGGMDITPSAFTGTIYRWSTTQVHNGDSIVHETYQAWCANHPEYGNSCDFGMSWNTEQECETYVETNMSGQNVTCEQGTVTTEVGEYTTNASTLNKTYYLKHDVVDDIITASYVCFVYNNSEHCMKGGDGGASFAANTQMIQDYKTFYNLGDYNYNNGNPTGCNFTSSGSHCNGAGFFQVSAHSDGYVGVNVSSSEGCSVSIDGDSNCHQ